MQVQHVFDPRTNTLTYVVWDESTGDAVVIDPVLDFDPAVGRVWTESADAVAAFATEHDLTVHWLLETHAHADHLSGAQTLAARLGARVAISERIREVQATFAPVFSADHIALDGSQFDRLLADGETLEAGSLRVGVLHTPGHTPACASFHIDDAVFTGDALFLPDFGTGRCDFPAGSAEDLYRSVAETLYALPDETRVFVGHDYQPDGRELRWETTIGDSKRDNIQLRGDTRQADFVRFRTDRDATLSAPRLLLPSIQVNIDAGRLPPAGPDGKQHLKLPLKVS